LIDFYFLTCLPAGRLSNSLIVKQFINLAKASLIKAESVRIELT
jgi:hypothetical protein